MKKIVPILLVVCMIILCVSCQAATTQTASPEASQAAASPAAASTAAASAAASEAASQAGSSAVDDIVFDTKGKTTGFKIGFAIGFIGNTWRGQFVDAIKEAAEGYKQQGVIAEYQIESANNDVTMQINQCNAMLSSGIDALLICAVNPTSLAPVVTKAKELGVLVEIANDPAAYPGTVCVAGDNESWSRTYATWFKEKMGAKGNIVMITGAAGNASDTQRNQVAEDVWGWCFNILAKAPGNWSQTDSQAAMTTFLSTYDNIDGVFSQDVMTEGIIKAYENAGKELPVITGDALYSTLKMLKEKNIDAVSIPYSPGVGATCVDIAVRMLQGDKLNPDSLDPNPLDPNLKNTIMVDPPYVVSNEGDPNAVWMEGITSEAITLDKALELLKSQNRPDTYVIDKRIPMSDLDVFFVK